MRKGLAALVLAAGSVAAVAWQRARQGRVGHVDLYFADGSMISFADGSPEAERLMPLAQDLLSAARS